MTVYPQHLDPDLIVRGVHSFTPHEPQLLRSAPAQPSLLSQEQRAELAHFRDSRMHQVTKWPAQILPSTTVIIMAHQGGETRLLVHQRADNGFWGFVGGGQHPGESIIACARREAYEETGLSVAPYHLVCVDSDPCCGALNVYPDNVVQYCNLTFVARVLAGELRPSPESIALQWTPCETLPGPFLQTHHWRLQQAWQVLAGGSVGVR